MKKNELHDDQMTQLLSDGKIEEFNARRQKGAACNLADCDLRGVDLRGMNAVGLDMQNAYLRDADLRGVNLSQTRLAGASIHGAKISGVLFPKELTADEIRLSLEHGTRMRYR